VTLPAAIDREPDCRRFLIIANRVMRYLKSSGYCSEDVFSVAAVSLP
jgi:hypothetical protein